MRNDDANRVFVTSADKTKGREIMIKDRVVGTMLGLSLALLAGNVQAEPHFSYSIVGDAGPYGAASVVGDSLVFAPVDFLATGSWLDFHSVTVAITADPGYRFTAFDLIESGGYSGGPVLALGAIVAHGIQGSTRKFRDGYVVASLASGAGTWESLAGIALPAPGWGGSDSIFTSANLTLSSLLFARGEGQIWKDAISVAVVTTPVPEAHTYAMFLAGLGLVGYLTRRRVMSGTLN